MALFSSLQAMNVQIIMNEIVPIYKTKVQLCIFLSFWKVMVKLGYTLEDVVYILYFRLWRSVYS